MFSIIISNTADYIYLLNQVSNAHSWTCMDIYVFATPYRVTWDYYFRSREHTLDFKEWEEKAEYEYVSGLIESIIASFVVCFVLKHAFGRRDP